MAISKSSITVLASSSSAAGASTKSAPSVTGSAIDCRTYYGGTLEYKITNGSAPAIPLSLTFQASQDGTTWYDYQTVAGDTVASSIASGCIELSRGVMYARAIAYGNTTNAVQVEANLMAVTAL